jgi:hypothetical protein
MKLKLKFLIATVIVLTIFIPVVQAQANLTFGGGNGGPLQIRLEQSVSYIITDSNCAGQGAGPNFIFDEVGDLLSSSFRSVTNSMTYTINGSPFIIDTAQSGRIGSNDVTVNDLALYASINRSGVSSGSIVVLRAGALMTRNYNYADAPPAGGSFDTFITNNAGLRCSTNGVVVGTTAASVSISGRVLTNSKRGLSNALVYLRDQEGNTRTRRTNSFGYYRFADIPVGQTYTISVIAKKYSFTQPTQLLSLVGDTDDVNFVADN